MHAACKLRWALSPELVLVDQNTCLMLTRQRTHAHLLVLVAVTRHIALLLSSRTSSPLSCQRTTKEQDVPTKTEPPIQNIAAAERLLLLSSGFPAAAVAAAAGSCSRCCVRWAFTSAHTVSQHYDICGLLPAVLLVLQARNVGSVCSSSRC